MRVQDVMKREARFTTPESSLAAAGRTMTEVDCGVLPVVEADRRVVGVITDRDICLALTSTDSKPSLVPVRQVMSGMARTCHPEHPIEEALRRMRENGVRRLPVVDSEGHLKGILSLDDIVLETRSVRGDDFTGPFYLDVVRTLKAIYTRSEGDQVH
ncbi:MAG TPA: CBS domain-containing protein [Thermoanaerobaculia bacterium]|nr:CBS domain-containing protein [Thermoanaerobaculia bacterium]